MGVDTIERKSVWDWQKAGYSPTNKESEEAQREKLFKLVESARNYPVEHFRLLLNNQITYYTAVLNTGENVSEFDDIIENLYLYMLNKTIFADNHRRKTLNDVYGHLIHYTLASGGNVDFLRNVVKKSLSNIMGVFHFLKKIFDLKALNIDSNEYFNILSDYGLGRTNYGGGITRAEFLWNSLYLFKKPFDWALAEPLYFENVSYNETFHSESSAGGYLFFDDSSFQKHARDILFMPSMRTSGMDIKILSSLTPEAITEQPTWFTVYCDLILGGRWHEMEEIIKELSPRVYESYISYMMKKS